MLLGYRPYILGRKREGLHMLGNRFEVSPKLLTFG